MSQSAPMALPDEKLPKSRTIDLEIRPPLGDPKVPALEIHTLLTIKHMRKGDVLSTQQVHNRVITDAFVEAIVDAMVATNDTDTVLTDFNDFQWHASGTGTTAEAQTQAILDTEVESRVSGTKAEGTTAEIYKSVATVTYTGTHTLREHAVFNKVSGGIMLDRTLFAAVSVVLDDKVEFTYEVTFTAGS